MTTKNCSTDREIDAAILRLSILLASRRDRIARMSKIGQPVYSIRGELIR